MARRDLILLFALTHYKKTKKIAIAAVDQPFQTVAELFYSRCVIAGACALPLLRFVLVVCVRLSVRLPISVAVVVRKKIIKTSKNAGNLLGRQRRQLLLDACAAYDRVSRRYPRLTLTVDVDTQNAMRRMREYLLVS